MTNFVAFSRASVQVNTSYLREVPPPPSPSKDVLFIKIRNARNHLNYPEDAQEELCKSDWRN